MSMRMRPLTAALGVVGLAVAAFAQPPTDPTSWSVPPANLAHIEGTVDVVHEGVLAAADPPLLLVDGDVVRTRNGRAEIVVADGTLIHLDRDSDLELLADGRWRLLEGRLRLHASAATTPIVVDTTAASVRLEPRGEYDLTSHGRRGVLDVAVTRGAATLDDQGRPVVVRAGESVSLDTVNGPRLARFNTARLDAFAAWSADRNGGFSTAASAARLPYELRPYGPVLDHYGRWDYVAPHGHVWFPAVGVSWRPYFDGSWGHTRYGWTWYGRDRWAWPTHHYGRWGFSGTAWFWIPAKVWGPAWVSWGFAPGYVSWSPLGWDSRPAIGLWRRDHPAYAPAYSPWRAWTVVPRDRFGPRRPVRAFAVDGDRLDEPTRRAMVIQGAGPPRPVGGAVPRGTFSVAGPAVASRDVDAPRPGAVRRPPGSRAPLTDEPARVTASPSVPARRATDAPPALDARPPMERPGPRERVVDPRAPGSDSGLRRVPNAVREAPPSGADTPRERPEPPARQPRTSGTPSGDWDRSARPWPRPSGADTAARPATPDARTREGGAAGRTGREGVGATPRAPREGAEARPRTGGAPAGGGAPRNQGGEGGARRRPPA